MPQPTTSKTRAKRPPRQKLRRVAPLRSLARPGDTPYTPDPCKAGGHREIRS